ncbi:putative 1-acyl-sn-glycerol-3-phosphate acyltransferase PLS1-like [Capsicum annuum]|nr:putative 1-acyl-sn-glycerol-3-phosphate acyltransferase PLS1-like [Capsicum annuum]
MGYGAVDGAAPPLTRDRGYDSGYGENSVGSAATLMGPATLDLDYQNNSHLTLKHLSATETPPTEIVPANPVPANPVKAFWLVVVLGVHIMFNKSIPLLKLGFSDDPVVCNRFLSVYARRLEECWCARKYELSRFVLLEKKLQYFVKKRKKKKKKRERKSIGLTMDSGDASRYSAGVEDYYESLLSTTDAELLKRAWRNEKAAPEILQYETALVQLAREQIQLMIENYAFHIQKNADLWNCISKQEEKFAERCIHDMEQHLDQSILSKLPHGFKSHLKQSSLSLADDMGKLADLKQSSLSLADDMGKLAILH